MVGFVRGHGGVGFVRGGGGGHTAVGVLAQRLQLGLPVGRLHGDLEAVHQSDGYGGHQ